jgi:hypothetical protein
VWSSGWSGDIVSNACVEVVSVFGLEADGALSDEEGFVMLQSMISGKFSLKPSLNG